MDSYSVQAVLSVKDKNFTSTMNSAVGVLSNLDSSTSKSSKSVGALGTAFAVAEKVISAGCNVIKNSVQAAVSRVDTLDRYPQIMEQMGFSSESAEASIEKLSEGIQGLPTSLDSIVASAQNIALISDNLDEATDVALALNNALIASGASTDAAASATEQYDKMLATGKVNSMSWMSLQQNMGYALKEVAKQCGIASGSTQELYDAMQNGTITFDQFNAALIECSEAEGGFAEMAQTSSAGIATSWENVKTAVVRGVANMIEAWNEAAADNGLPTIQESLNGLRNVCDTVFNAASKAITVFVNNLDTIVAAVAPVVAAVAGLKIVQTVSKYFESFKSRAKESVNVLQNYQSKAEQSAKATEKLKSAEELAQKTAERYATANEKANEALVKKVAAQENAEAAAKKEAEAAKAAAEATENSAEAQAAYETAIKESAKAQEEAVAATKEYEAAKQAESVADQDAAAAAQASAAAQQEHAAAIEGTSIKAIAMSAVMNVLSGEMTIAEAATKAFNAAMDANPIGMVTTAISALVSVVGVLSTVFKKLVKTEDSAYDKWKDLKEEIDDLNDSIEESDKQIESTISSSKKSADSIRTLANQVKNLSNVQGLTADGTALLKSKIAELNELVPGLGLAYDDLTGSLNMTTEAMDALTDAWAAQEELAGTQDALAEAMATRDEIANTLAETQAHLNEMDSEGEVITMGTMVAYQKEQKASEELTAELEAQEAKVSELNDAKTAQQEEVTQAILAAYDAQVAGLQQMVAEDTIAYEDLSEVNQQTVDDMKSSIESLVDTMNDGTSAIVTDLGVTRDEYLNTMEQNQQAVEEWGNNMESLRDRMEGLGLDTAVLDQWAEVPDEGIPLAAEFVNASDEELQRLAELSGSSTEEAAQALLQGWGVATEEIPSAIQEYITEPTNESISEQLRNIDWAEPSADLMQNLFDSMGDAVDGLSFDELGISMDEGVAEGLETSAAGQEAAETNVQLDREAAGAAAGEGSPASEWIPLGQSMDEGVAEGLNTSMAGVEAAQQMAERIKDAVQTSLDAMDYSGVFDSLADAAKSGMSQVSKAVTSGMSAATQALSSGFSQMASVTTSSIATISAAVTSGMNNIRSLVTSAINTIKATVTSGVNAIKTTVTSGMTSIKSTIQSAMTTCKNYVTNGMNSIKTAFQNGMNKCVSVAQSTCSSIVSAFSGLYSSLYSSGASAMSGLQAGLNSRSGSVIATAQSIANSVTSTINSALRVGSPSKVLKKTGQNAGEGLVVGLKDMIPDIEAMAGKMADAVTNMAFGSFESPRLAFDGGSMTMTYDYGTGDILDTLSSIRDALEEDTEYTFNIPLDIDGKEVAKATATYTQDELNRLQARSDRRNQFSIGG